MATVSAKRAYDYDLVVIGGGSGGLAASKEAVKVKPDAKVLVFDFVQPSIAGTKWGLGGTCVNVGCVPKKLMHYSSLIGHTMRSDAPEFGWQGLDQVRHDWVKMRDTVTNYIRSLNFSYKGGLRSAGVQYIEAYAQMIDAHTIAWKGTRQSGQVSCDRVLVATGGRPNLGPFPGKEVCLSSDDLFWLKRSPGKTLVIGAGYIALECAGFLHHLGLDVTMMVRGQFMRKFDMQCAGQIGELMERSGVRFLIPASPLSFRKLNQPQPPPGSVKQPNGTIMYPDQGDGITRLQYPSGAVELRPKTGRSTWQIPEGPVLVEYKMNTPGGPAGDQVLSEQFDSVLIATGRTACVEDLCLDKLGVRLREGKILVNDDQQTSVPNIYAIGDVSIGEHFDFPELTPVAIQVGQQLARRLFANSKERFNYQLVASTVFAPVEYGFVGLSQDQAEKDEKDGGIGKQNVEVFYSRFGHLEISPTHAHVQPLRSRAFVGKNSWTYRYCEANGLLWPELGFEVDNQVLVSQNNSTAPLAGKIVARSNSSGRWLFDVELDSMSDTSTVLKAVPLSQLELPPDAETENAELFVKATNLAKLVVDKRTDRVIGIHFIGPNAGEVLQGFGFALHFGAKKADFDRLTGIHPTAAEEFCVLHVTKSSGKSPLKKAGCGGGTCG